MVKLVDIARAANVSKAAVSYAFSSDPAKRSKLSAGTLERILATAAKFNYRPSMAGRGLSLGRSFSVVLLLPSHCARNISSHNLGMFHGVSSVISSSDYNLLVFFGCQKRFLADLAQHRFDGVMMISKLADAAAIHEVEQTGVPFVLLGRSYPVAEKTGSVGSDFTAWSERFLRQYADRQSGKLYLYCRLNAGQAVDEEVVKAVQTIAGKYQMQLELKELDDFRQAPEDAGAVMFRSVTPEVEAFLAASTIPATVWTGKKLPVRQDMLLSYHDSFNIGASGAELLLDMISGKRPAQNILIDSCGTEYYQNKFADYTLDF